MSDRSIVDRKTRDVLAEAIRQFVEGELCPSELEDIAYNYCSSDDNVVNQICMQFMDELDSPRDWPKPVWDEVQRWLLLLDSDRQLEETIETIWTRWQLVATFGVIFIVGFGLLTNFMLAFTWLSLPSGLLSWYITRKRAQKLTPKPYEHVLNPFESFGSMRQTLDEVNDKFGFVKMKQTNTRPQRKGRKLSTLETLIYYALLPTIFLLPFQALPLWQTHRRVVANA